MKSKTLNRLLIVAIAAPIVVALVVGGGAAIWHGIVTIVKTLIPNGWTLLGYAYVAFIGFLIGQKKK